jgi:hypothetical protein
VDLLDATVGIDSINQWKLTIPENPAPVSFTLQPLSAVLPPPRFEGDVDIRKEMDQAVRSFLTLVQQVDILKNIN